MSRRLLGAAFLACLVVLAVGAGAAVAIVDSARGAVLGAATSARELLAAGAEVSVVAASVQRPGVIAHVPPPRGRAPAPPSGGAGLDERPPPPEDGPPGDGPPPPGAPPPPPAAPPPARGGRPDARTPLGAAAMVLIRMAPLRLGVAPNLLDIIPDGDWVGRRLALDFVATLVGLVVVAATTWAVGSALERASRSALLATAMALERVAAADFTPREISASGSEISARLARAYKAAVDQVAKSFEERQAAAREFQRFLADAGHELRTPLTIVSGYVDLLDNEKGAVANGDRIVAGMRAETKRMRNLVEKMLLLARMESPRSAPRMLVVGESLADAVEAARTRYPGRAIALTADDDVTIVADEDDFFEAVYNLVENALRYAPDSDVAVEVTHTPQTAFIAVSDRGPGITAEEQTHIFERFYRGGTRRNAEGSGLGLAIVKRAVERWSGTVEVASSPGNTRFTLAFPLAAVDAS